MERRIENAVKKQKVSDIHQVDQTEWGRGKRWGRMDREEIRGNKWQSVGYK